MSVTVYYEQGQVVKILPEPNKPYYEVRDIINDATSIVSDGVHYDLTDRKSINSIEVPQYTYSHENRHAQDLGTTGYLDYVLRMHAGGLWDAGDYSLSMSCLRKACQLMLHSPIAWSRKDYYRIVEDYMRLGQFKKAKEWADWIEKYTDAPEDLAHIAFARTRESCKFLKTDLVEVGDLSGMCATCAKYRKRIYSLSGKSLKFPKFPKDFHFQCGLGISPFVDGVDEPTFNCKNYVLYSHRPFKDDRTAREIENHEKHLEMLSAQKKQFPDMNHVIYYCFKPIFPDIFPKSVGAFARMRNSNSKKYQELMKIVRDSGYRIPSSLEEAAQLDFSSL